MKAPTWRSVLTRWARESGATHARVEGVGPARRLKVTSIPSAITSFHGDTTGFMASSTSRSVTIGPPGKTLVIDIEPDTTVQLDAALAGE